MRRFIVILPLLLMFLAGCNEYGKEPEVDQTLICTLTAPEANSEIELSEGSFEIAGDALVNTGTISSVILKVSDYVIDEVNSVPFTYTYTISEGQEAGKMTITLNVKGDKGAEGTDEVTVTLIGDESGSGEEPGNGEEPGDGEEPGNGEEPGGGEEPGNNGEPGNGEEPGNNGEPGSGEEPGNGEESGGGEEPGNNGEPGNGEETMTDARDGKVYKTVTLGTQVWMAENLAYLPEVHPSEVAADSGTNKCYYVLNYQGTDTNAAKKTEEYDKFGVLYNWFAANDCNTTEGADAEAIPSGVRGACPEGWHLPSRAEWQLMESWVAEKLDPVTGLNSSYETDRNMKNVWSALAGIEVGWGESAMIDENPDLINGPRDLFGFCAKPAGKCWQTGEFGESDADTGFWATNMQTYGGCCVELRNSQYTIAYTKSGYQASRGYSVRCVQD